MPKSCNMKFSTYKKCQHACWLYKCNRLLATINMFLNMHVKNSYVNLQIPFLMTGELGELDWIWPVSPGLTASRPSDPPVYEKKHRRVTATPKNWGIEPYLTTWRSRSAWSQWKSECTHRRLHCSVSGLSYFARTRSHERTHVSTRMRYKNLCLF